MLQQVQRQPPEFRIGTLLAPEKTDTQTELRSNPGHSSRATGGERDVRAAECPPWMSDGGLKVRERGADGETEDG